LNKISFSINYVTNFKPSKNFNENYTFYKNKNNIILCKHFIIFFYLIRFVLRKNSNVVIFFKPKKSKIETLLRPPYRHKISRHQITLSRYFILVSFNTNFANTLSISNTDQVLILLKEIKGVFNFFETNICFTHSIKIRTFFHYNNLFKLMNYKH
jgi:hypothetical protein